MTNFEALGLSASLLRALEKHGFNTPTEIQVGAIPPLLEGHDVVGLADTGTGKTAAFLLPVLERLHNEPVSLNPGAPRALILAPTRELAQQIGEAMNTLSGFLHLRSLVVFGGAPMHKQLLKLKAGVDILIATPGRLMDHVRRGSVKFDDTDIFILDEADRMLDMGFVNDVKAISRALPTPHQTVMFSATINKSVEGLTKILLNDPVRVDIAKSAKVNSNIEHRVMHLAHENKKTLLQAMLEQSDEGQVIVFTKTKRGADSLARDLIKAGLKADAIHGDRNQRQRQRTLNRFRHGSIDILIATDVAARGIDVPGIACVINYDLPLEADSYVHRVGRTGRNGMSGVALSFCTSADIGLLRDIEHLIGQKIEVDTDQEFHVDPPERAPRGHKKFGRKPPRSRAQRGPRPDRPRRARDDHQDGRSEFRPDRPNFQKPRRNEMRDGDDEHRKPRRAHDGRPRHEHRGDDDRAFAKPRGDRRDERRGETRGEARGERRDDRRNFDDNSQRGDRPFKARRHKPNHSSGQKPYRERGPRREDGERSFDERGPKPSRGRGPRREHDDKPFEARSSNPNHPRGERPANGPKGKKPFKSKTGPKTDAIGAKPKKGKKRSNAKRRQAA